MFSGTHIPKHKSPSISELCFVNPTVSRMELKGKEEEECHFLQEVDAKSKVDKRRPESLKECGNTFHELILHVEKSFLFALK